MNLGNPAEFTVLELALLVIRLTGSLSRVVYLPLPADDPQKRRPVIDRARSALGFEPKIPLTTGLRRTIKHFKRAIHGPHAEHAATAMVRRLPVLLEGKAPADPRPI